MTLNSTLKNPRRNPYHRYIYPYIFHSPIHFIFSGKKCRRKSSSQGSISTDISNENQLNKIDLVSFHIIFKSNIKLNTILAQWRCSASFFNNDLFRADIVNDPFCQCGDRY